MHENTWVKKKKKKFALEEIKTDPLGNRKKLQAPRFWVNQTTPNPHLQI